MSNPTLANNLQGYNKVAVPWEWHTRKKSLAKFIIIGQLYTRWIDWQPKSQRKSITYYRDAQKFQPCFGSLVSTRRTLLCALRVDGFIDDPIEEPLSTIHTNSWHTVPEAGRNPIGSSAKAQHTERGKWLSTNLARA